MNSPAPAFSAAAPAATAPEAPRDALVAKVLAVGAFVTAVIAAPGQTVLPDTLKSACAALFVTVALALLVWRRAETRVPLRWSLYVLPPLALALLAGLSMLWAPATGALMESARWLVIGLTVLVTLNVAGPGSFPWFARAVHWAAIVTSLLALLEFWFGVSPFPASAAPGSSFGNRNLFAEYVAVALPFSLWLLLRETRTRSVVIHGIGVGLILLAVMSTGTRAALIAVGVALVATSVFLVAWRSRGGDGGRAGWLPLALAIALPLVVVAALGWLPTRNGAIIQEHREGARGLTIVDRAFVRVQTLASPGHYTGNSSFGRRVSVWSAGLGMLGAHPVLGVGGGAWNTDAPLYLPDNLDTESIWMAHNEPLQLVAELGLLAWLALAAMAVLLARSTWGVWQDLRSGRTDLAFMRWSAVLVVLCFGVVSVSGLPLHQAPTALLLALALGWLMALGAERTVPADKVPSGAWSAAKWGTAALALVAAVLSFQGLRSDMLVQRSLSVLLGLQQTPNLPPADAARYRAEASEDIKRGLGIFPDHGMHLIRAASTFAALGDAASVVWLSNLMLQTRPHVAEVKCNLARAHSDLGDFAAAGALVQTLIKERPHSPCLPLTRFVYEYKRANFAGAVALGREMMGDPGAFSAAEMRYIIDQSYRAAVRVPDVDGAVAILQTRAERYPEYRAGSYFLIGQLLAQRAAAGTVAPEAVAAFRQALAVANDAERQALMTRIPEAYRPKVQ